MRLSTEDDVNAPDRDSWELAIAEAAVRQGVPLLGICRGAQMLNVACGGTLHQHVPTSSATSPRRPTDGFGTHKVRVTSGTIIASILPGGEYFEVPTHHHQAVDQVGSGLTAVAWADDGIVEGIESTTSGEFLVGVQWHPEQGNDPRLFGASSRRRKCTIRSEGWPRRSRRCSLERNRQKGETGLSGNIPLRPACSPGIHVSLPVVCCCVGLGGNRLGACARGVSAVAGPAAAAAPFGQAPAPHSPRQGCREKRGTPVRWLGLRPCGCCGQALRRPQCLLGLDRTQADRHVHGAELAENLVAVLGADVRDHVAELVAGAQQLPLDVHAMVGEHPVDRGEHAGHVIVQVDRAGECQGPREAPDVPAY